MRTLIVSLIILFFTGCDQSVPDHRSFEAPPSGQGHYLDEDGVNRSVFKVVGTFAYGETRTLSAEHGKLLGYTFFGQADDAPVIRLQTQSSATFSMALYGPQSTQGLWGNHLVERHGKSVVTLADFSLRNNGVYFVLIRIFGAESGMADIELTCDECEASSCQSIAACDLFCPNGRPSDQNGCPCVPAAEGRVLSPVVMKVKRASFHVAERFVRSANRARNGRCVDELCPMSCDPGDVCLDGQCEQRPYHCAAGQQLWRKPVMTLKCLCAASWTAVEGAFQVNAAPSVPVPRRSWTGAVETNVRRSYRARKDNCVRRVGVFLTPVRNVRTSASRRCLGAMAKHTGIGASWNAHPTRQKWPMKVRASFSVTASLIVALVRLVCPFHPLRSLQTERAVERILRVRDAYARVGKSMCVPLGSPSVAPGWAQLDESRSEWT